MITDRLIEGIIDMQNPTCVGLDTLFDYLPDDMKQSLSWCFNCYSERTKVKWMPTNKQGLCYGQVFLYI